MNHQKNEDISYSLFHNREKLDGSIPVMFSKNVECENLLNGNIGKTVSSKNGNLEDNTLEEDVVNEPVTCSADSLCFPSVVASGEHALLHSDEHVDSVENDIDKSISCSFCSMRFPSEDVLSQHVVVHSQDSQKSIGSSKYSLRNSVRKQAQETKNTYRCTECPWAFSSHEELQNHLIKTHSEDEQLNATVIENKKVVPVVGKGTYRTKIFRCSSCYKSFPKRSELRKHSVLQNHFHGNSQLKSKGVKENTLKRTYRCGSCYKTFSKRGELRKHNLLHTDDEISFTCQVCGASFPRRNDLRVHRIVHQEIPPTCEVCGKTFSQAGNLKIHLRTHTKEKPYACEICGKRYAQSGDLRTHIRVHTDDKPFLCEYCGILFHSLSHLSRHNKVHTHEKPHVCKVCDKAFAHTHHLKKHYRIHTQEKPYSCDICDKAFTRADYLKQHIRVHTKEKPYKCKICGKGFSQGGSLRLHQRVHQKQGWTYPSGKTLVQEDDPAMLNETVPDTPTLLGSLANAFLAGDTSLLSLFSNDNTFQL